MMKQEEVKVGLWLASNGGQPLARVVMFDDKGALLEDIYGERHWCTKYYLEIYRRIATPAELSAAGIADADRLVEQQDWRIGVELFALDDIVRVSVVEVKVDGERIADATDTAVEAIVRTFNSFNRDVTNDPQCLKFYSVFLRDFVLSHRSRRAGGEGAGKVGVKEKFTIGGKNIFRWRRYGGKPWNCEEYANGVWNPAEPTDEVEGEKDATPADLAASGILISDIANPELRSAVKALRRPTLPDGSKIEVGEMYVSGHDELWIIETIEGSRARGKYWNRSNCEFFGPSTPGVEHSLAGRYVVNGSEYSDNSKSNLKRLAQPADIPNEIDINIVPERIREQVRQQRDEKRLNDSIEREAARQQRGAGALKWNGWYIFRQPGNEQQRWEFGQWVPVPDPHKTIDEMATASPPQIIAANVPEQDIPACQIEGVRAERERRASETKPKSFAREWYEWRQRHDEWESKLGEFDGVDFTHTDVDSYDESIEIYGCPVAMKLCPDALAFLYAAGFKIAYINHVDGSETHYRGLDDPLTCVRSYKSPDDTNKRPSSPSPESGTPFDETTWPIGAWLKHNSKDANRFHPARINGYGVTVNVAENEETTLEWSRLAECFIFTLNGKSWHRCIVESLNGATPQQIIAASSPSPDSGSCQCEAANTLRDLIEAFDGWNDAKTHASLTEGYQSLRRKFELARESLGEASNTEAA